ncbi:MAG: c-type cytochrome biogenesis protein CcmI [Acidiferrobacterales bacterium]
MILFWSIIVFMIVVALVILIVPVLRARPETGPDRKAINIELYKSQLNKLEEDLKEGLLDQQAFDAAKQEIDRNLLDDTADSDSVAQAKSGRVPAIITAIVVPVVAISLYLGLGRADLVDVQPQKAPNVHQIEQMMSKLINHLKENPNDSEGWVMLGRSYTALNEYGKAEDAYKTAYKLIGDDPDFLADYAEIIAMNRNNELAGEPRKLLRIALKKNPDAIKALWLSGHAELQLGNDKQAVAYWKKLLKVLPSNDTEAINTVNQYIAQVEGQAPPPPVASASAKLTVKVSLAPSIRASVKPDETVFIFARAASGPRMPLAIVRKQVKDLPLTVTLDDSMAMAPQMTLSKFDKVVVGARVSKTGTALPQSGDIQGLSPTIQSAQKDPVSIVINSVVP